MFLKLRLFVKRLTLNCLLQLENLYQNVRDIRTKNNAEENNLLSIFDILKTEHETDWLLPLELLELAEKFQFKILKTKVSAYLQEKKDIQPNVAHLISDGIDIINENN